MDDNSYNALLKKMWENSFSLYKGNYKRFLPLDIAAVYFTSGGGQGTPGKVSVVTMGGTQFEFNYAYGDLPAGALYEICPFLKETKFQFNKVTTPQGWKGYYIGGGNFFLVCDKIGDEFDDAINHPNDKDEVISGMARREWCWLLLSQHIVSKRPDFTPDKYTEETGCSLFGFLRSLFHRS